jgi:hypothetical protein
MLADFLDNVTNQTAELVAHERFLPPTIYRHNTWHYVRPEDGRTCACALGMAMFSPAFQAEGLKPMNRTTELGTHTLIPSYKGQIAFRAAMEFFEIPADIASSFFRANHDHTSESAETVALAVRQYVASVTDTPPPSDPEPEPVTVPAEEPEVPQSLDWTIPDWLPHFLYGPVRAFAHR